MEVYTLSTRDSLTAHRVAGVVYARLCPRPENAPSGQPSLMDQVPGEYFHDLSGTGYRVQAKGIRFEVQVGSTKPKSARELTCDFRVVLEKSGGEGIDPKNFERAVREVQSALGREGGRA